MAAVQPYQRVLLENRDILLNDLNTDDIIPLLFLAKVLSNKEIDDIEIGRTRREKTESLLDVLHYKGERGFDEFCKALEETFPHLASRMSRRESQTERSEKYHNEQNLSSRYSTSYSEHERSHREINGDDFHRISEHSSERVIGSERPTDMRGDPEPQYAQVTKRPKDSSLMDSSRRGEDNRSVSSYHSQRHDRDRDTRSLDGDRRRTPRRTMDEVNPSESYIYEKNTVVVEKANTSQGFGIAVSGGRDNPHYKTGDTSIVVSDIVKGSPADGLLRVNDVIVQVNDVNVENVYHRDAVQALKDSGVSARLIIKRRKAMPALPKKNGSLPTTVHLSREPGRGFGFSLAMRLYIKDIDPKGLAFHEGELDPGDVILKINDRKAEELKLREAIELVRKSDHLELVVAKHKMDNLNLSTRSLPSALHKKGFNSKPVENGVDDSRNDKDDVVVERRRAKSMDRAYIKNQRRLRTPSDNEDVGRGRSRSVDRNGHEVQSEKPVIEQAVVKQEVKTEESVPDLPPRRYSDAEAPKRPLPPDEEDRGGAPFSSSSWKRLDNERPKEEEHRAREPERRDYVPQPADVTRTEATMDLSMKTWDSLSPGRTPARESPGSTPQSQRREKPRDYLAEKDTKVISFRKEGSLGIQIQGGNKTGIFVAAVRESNPAHRQGLRRGDQVLMANDIDFKDITREEAVLLLLSLGDDVRLLAQPKISTFERIKNSPGDSFYIKAHFDYAKMKEDELDINREDVFHVWDTMYGGMIGSWHAQRVTLNNEETETGIIPNKCRAEQLGQVRQVEEDKTSSKKASRTNSLKRKDSRGGTLKKNYLFVSTDRLDKESFINTAREFKLPAYERVSLRHPGFVRPVVLLGPIADITRDKLLQDLPQYFAIPTAYGGITPAGHDSPTKSSRRTLSYSTIKTVIDSSKHCLLDIAPDEVERLNYSQLYPIVLFLKPTNKNVVKEMRAQHGSGKESAKHINKLYDNSVKLEQFYFNMISATIPAGPSDDWYGRVKDEIKKQQDRRVWMSEDKFEHDEHDVEFRVHNRYSTGYEYDSHADSPTARSSVSHPPEEEIRPSAELGVESTPRHYNGPEVEYRDDRGRYDDDRDRSRYDDDRDRDRSRYDDDRNRSRYDDDRDRDRSRYDDERGRYDDRPDRYDDDRDRRPYDDDQRYDSDIDRPSKPGYKPHGNIVKVLPSSQEPVELRASLRKTRPLSDDFTNNPPDSQDGEELRPRDSLRRAEPESRPQDAVNPTELELRYKAESLRKVEPESDLLKKYDERVGVKVSDLWAIDNEVQRERIQPQEVSKVESKPDDLERKLEELERAIPPPQPKEEPKKVIPAPYRFEPKPRNVVVDYRSKDRPESVVRTSYYPARSYATVTHVESKSEPEVRAHVIDRVESAPVVENGYRSLPRDYGRGAAEPERKEIYRAEVTIPRKETKPERPKSAYGYSSQAYAPRPYGSDRSSEPPPRPAQPTNYDFKLSSRPQPEIRREPEPRPGTYRSEYRPKVADFEAHRDDSQVITSDFESLDDDTQVVATARGTFTSKGGILSSPESGVSIHIPEGAIPYGIEQEIYFKVCKDNNIMPPLDTDKGETLLSPLVMCGPHGTQFLKPVELRLPHCASMTPDGWSFALKSSETPTGMPTQWQNVSIPGQEKKGDPNSVSVLVDHF
ncbi:tight junction protein ZO-1-like isoform X3 [Actinia tenebrosa]|uniref:Tight junction protein ZO-1-like isoform X3 n=1 Tax=Actinia tenebrosa TaxID=6105 RepID=A0A6P8J666_ACTTE|nr:tight junction protein ZO-1-like isoform X3 [Actinia tenebrosa]